MLVFGDQVDDPNLTTRERQVMELVACGMSAKQIAQEVGIAPRTVERHIENCRHKMRARNKAHMVAKAIALGELSLTSNGRGSGGDRAEAGFRPQLLTGS